jgi:hypothetical protein
MAWHQHAATILSQFNHGNTIEQLRGPDRQEHHLLVCGTGIGRRHVRRRQLLDLCAVGSGAD